MLLLPLVLLAVLFPAGDNQDASRTLEWHHSTPAEPLTFRIVHITSFANHSWAHTQLSAWLGELQTHAWDNVSDTIRFEKPWSHGYFSKEQWKKLQALFQLFIHGFPREVQNFASQFQFDYPFVLQISSGCTMQPGKAYKSFLNGAYQGLDLLSFQGSSWEPAPGSGRRAQNVCRVLNQYLIIKEIVHSLLSDTCPRFLAGLLEAGKSELERQVKPEVWLSSGPSPGPGHLQLVCHVSGFHPKPVWVMWMRGDQEQAGTRYSDILPNADETWYLRATLDVAAGQTAGLSCRVKHSSLGGHDIVIHWAGGHSLLPTLMCLTVVVALAMVILQACWRKQSSNKSVLSPYMPNSAFPMEAKAQDPKSPAHQLYLAQESWIKARIRMWKISLNQ
ncbi:PREDICTED: T-cell surface glycoprotein CD1e, membrane-associated isoform X1 [Dipodomys ordii]|uniref:T-cell surface glycoprotein CD1e, membrane-associated isoform X1 n=1 Tax=Dipodomys ordii TaxID=10020 RepID=A0A1S3GCV9_DIPOR|nr:PREDICTED: T-cell surface glycoprotein CD1e, membrane-associated isoform X1 [Dipodomys ordii]XP_012886074.1 PREDICTED: T-cell surface glycoprotein CD1e, membrane-associated isoform X1 [Dipodomys ordii]XP_012886075.1 PREDICTED: T-cell surface glycoprotein CD1e, membrane-associated isoform X1 [Dipodomys ordii]